MADPVTIGIGIALSAVSQKIQANAAKKRERAEQARFDEASSKDEKRVKAEQRRQDVIASRQKRAAAADARRKIAQSEQLAVTQGAGGAIGSTGSTLPGIAGNITSQLSANNTFVSTVSTLTNQATQFGGEATRIAARPLPSGTSAFGAIVGQAGSFVLNNSKEIGAFSKKNFGFS